MVKIALLIGVSNYKPGLNALPAALKDVEVMKQVLQNPKMGEFSEVRVLRDPDPLSMQESIEALFSECGRDDLALLFFSGHGIKDDSGKLYFATRITRKNQRGELVKSTAVPANFVHDMMSNSRSRRQVIILDCCFSGAFARDMIVRSDDLVDVKSQLGGEGRVVLTSSTSTQYSFEQSQSDFSIYTQHLVEGITTGAADLDRDDMISVDELHEYARSRVQDVAPMMKPEIYAFKGHRIFLAKAPTVDPKLRYRKEVELVAIRGEILFVGRKTLDILQRRLGLTLEEAIAIENDVLEPLRKEFQNKLQQYQQVFTELMEQELPFTQETRQQLQHLQQMLGLRDKDVETIEGQVAEQLRNYKQNLQHYEQALVEIAGREYPMSDRALTYLKELQQQFGLKHRDVEPIHTRIIAEASRYYERLHRYKETFRRAVQQEFPLQEQTRIQLRQLQQSLALQDNDIVVIENFITQPIEEWRQKLSEYEQALIEAVQQEYPLEEEMLTGLRNLQRVLALDDNDTLPIQTRIFQQREAEVMQQTADVIPAFDEPVMLRNVSLPKTASALTVQRPFRLRLPTIRISRNVYQWGGGVLTLVGLAFGSYFYTQWQADQTLQLTLEQLKNYQASGNYDECLKQAQSVPPESLLYAEAQMLLNNCQVAQVNAQITQAQQLAADNNFKEAIALLLQIPETMSRYTDAQTLIDQWSTTLISQATQLYETGKLNDAIATLQLIPADTANGKNAQQLITQWQTNWSESSKNLEAAQDALKQRQWQVAISAAEKVMDTPYWQAKVESIIQEAKAGIAATPTPRPTPSPIPTASRTPVRRTPIPTRTRSPEPRPTFTPAPIPTATFTPAPIPTN